MSIVKGVQILSDVADFGVEARGKTVEECVANWRLELLKLAEKNESLATELRAAAAE